MKSAPTWLVLAVSLVLIGGTDAHALTITPNGYAFDREPAFGVLSLSEGIFEDGAKNRHNSVLARKLFRESARGYDDLWRRGHRNPAIALNRSRAHRLAGDLPGAIAALHDGLAVARYDRALQVELEDARSAVAYPLDGELTAQCKPHPSATIGTRMSPAEGYLAAGLLWLLACLGAVRFAMTRNWLWVGFAGLCFACLVPLGWLWWQDWRQQTRDEARPLMVVKEDVTLRKGNGENWEPRLPSKLPKGAEARELTRRGGWVQVELAGGAVGWLPEAAVLNPAGR